MNKLNCKAVKEYSHYCCCSVAQSCLNLCNHVDCSMTGFPVLYHLSELAQTHVHWVSYTTQPPDPLLSTFPASVIPSIRIFSSDPALHIVWPKYWSFISSIHPSNEYWFILGLTGLISLQSKRLSRVFSNTIFWRDQFVSAQPFLSSSSHIHTWLLDKP